MAKDNENWLAGQLPGLQSEGVLDAAAVQRLREHYQLDASGQQNHSASTSETASSIGLVTIVLAALGGLLIGGGIILIFAHNWQDFSRPVRAALAFAPLAFAQLLALAAIYPQRRGPAWREVAAALLFCAVPASIALIGQTYHISDDTRAFLSWWFVLLLPFVYLLQAHLTAVLLTVLAAVLAAKYASPYWLCLLVMLPYYGLLLRQRGAPVFSIDSSGDGRAGNAGHAPAQSRYARWLGQYGWVLGLALAWSLPIVLFQRGELQQSLQISIVAVLAAAALMYLAGSYLEPARGLARRPFTSLGALALAGTALLLSFGEVWLGLLRVAARSAELVARTVEVAWHQRLFEGLLIAAAVVLIAYTIRHKRYSLLPLVAVFVLVAIVQLLPLHLWQPTAFAVLFNGVVIALGVGYLYRGVRNDSSSQLNFGLLLLLALLLLRFFDQDLSFIARGLAFIISGVALIGINIWHSRKRRGSES